jgi:DNA-binding transcriptional MocR family regulator
VYGALAMHLGRNATAFPNQRTLADEINMGVRQIRNAISVLKKAGLIDCQRRKVNGRRAGNEYSLPNIVKQAKALNATEGQSCPDRQSHSSHERQKSAPVREQAEKKMGEDLDSPLPHRKNRDEPAVGPEWPNLSALIASQLGRTPTRSALGRIIGATPKGTEAEAIQAIQQALRRGYGRGSNKEPRSVAYFESIVRNYWERENRYALPPPAPVTQPVNFARAPFDTLDNEDDSEEGYQ